MASAGIAALLKKMDYKDVAIAIDGSLFRYHPHFKNIMQSHISQVLKDMINMYSTTKEVKIIHPIPAHGDNLQV